MRIRRITTRALADERDGVRFAAGVNAVVAGTVDDGRSSESRVSARQRLRVVQRRRRPEAGGGKPSGDGDAV